MVTFTGFLFIYILGGLTFIPLVLGLLLLHAHLTLPVRELEKETVQQPEQEREQPRPQKQSKREDVFNTDLSNLPSELKVRTHEPDVAAGYFAVCREYVPGGVNGKPPERTTPAGAAVAPESPSVYQSMYRSIFDRNKSQTPSIDSGKVGGKKARNVFYVVLRHGHLMLYDDIEQLEVRHVISLAYHDVDVYAGGETIPEGEMWIKRNCIRLTRKRTFGDGESDAKPFYLFSENCSEKEDFYLAMLASQEKKPGSPDSPPTPLQFETAHIIKLVQQLHASEENMQTRWINALIGRLFLAMYKTPDVEEFVRMKLTKKIARVPKPAFITSIKIRKIEMGDAAPFITNPKLRELTVDGDLTVEADVHYKGNFRLEIAAVARIDLGSRLKAREVDLILAGVLKKLDGHLLIRMKPPPSNRLWISFERAPTLDLSIEPIVSSRQITYGVILRAIESRIREVMMETLVLPNWDDTPFHDTMLQRFRGGIWEDDVKVKPLPDHKTEMVQQGLVDQVDKPEDLDEIEGVRPASDSVKEKTMSMPSLFDTAPASLKSRKSVKSMYSWESSESIGETAMSSGAESPASYRTVERSAVKPKSMRTSSFSSTAAPIVNLDAATVEALQSHNKKGKGPQDATSLVKDISLRSQTASPMESPMGSPPQAQTLMEHASLKESVSSAPSVATKEEDASETDPSATAAAPQLPRRRSTHSSVSTENSSIASQNIIQPAPRPKHSHSVSSTPSIEKRQTINQSITSATAAAKKWFAARHNTKDPFQAGSKEPPTTSQPSSETAAANPALSHSPQLGTPEHPIGRGQPLPPPGTPLPRPPKEARSWAPALGTLNLTKRKPVSQTQASAIENPPPLPKRPSAPPTDTFPSPTIEAQAQPQSSTQLQPEVSSPALSLLNSLPPSTQASTPGSTSSTPPPSLPTLPIPAVMKPAESGSGQSHAHPTSPKRRPVGAPPYAQQRRKRSSNARIVLDEPGNGDGLLVVEAPVADHSAPVSPIDMAGHRGEGEIDDEIGEGKRRSESGGEIEDAWTKGGADQYGEKGRERQGSDDAGIFEGMEMDEGSGAPSSIDLGVASTSTTSTAPPLLPPATTRHKSTPSMQKAIGTGAMLGKKSAGFEDALGEGIQHAMDEKNADRESLKLLEEGWKMR